MASISRLAIPLTFEDAVRSHERELMRYLMRATGDRATCEEATALLGAGLTTVEVKAGLGRFSARMKTPREARRLIEGRDGLPTPRPYEETRWLRVSWPPPDYEGVHPEHPEHTKKYSLPQLLTWVRRYVETLGPGDSVLQNGWSTFADAHDGCPATGTITAHGGLDHLLSLARRPDAIERAEAALHPGDLPRRRGRPADRDVEYPGMLGELVAQRRAPAFERGPPGLARDGRRRLPHCVVDHQHEQLVLALDVAVEGHRREAEPLGLRGGVRLRQVEQRRRIGVPPDPEPVAADQHDQPDSDPAGQQLAAPAVGAAEGDFLSQFLLPGLGARQQIKPRPPRLPVSLAPFRPQFRLPPR